MAIFFARSIGPVVIDCVLSEEPKGSMEIPSHPVEKGAKISDHAWRLPTTLKMEIASADQAGTWQALTDLMAEAEPFDILSGFDLFESMMIEEVEAKRDVSWPVDFLGTVSLKEIIIVETATTAGNAGTGGDERGQSKTARGQVQARKVSTDTGRGAEVKSTLPQDDTGAGLF